MRDYEISHSTIQLELESFDERGITAGNDPLTQYRHTLNSEKRQYGMSSKCLLTVQPFSTLTFLDIILGSDTDSIGNANHGTKKKSSRVKKVQLIIGMGKTALDAWAFDSSSFIDLFDWTLNDNTNTLHIPLPLSQSSSKQFHVLIWFQLNRLIPSSLLHTYNNSASNVIYPTCTPTLVLDQHNMLNWFPCVVDDKYPMDWLISVPSHCPVTGIRFAPASSSGRIVYKYSCKIPISPKSVVIVIGAFESIKVNARNLGQGADLLAAADEMPELLHTMSNAASTRIKVFYQKEWDKNLIYSTCQYLPQALEFVEQWVGASYPFTSLKIVFSGTSSVPIISGATLMVVNIQLLISDRDLDHVWFSRFYLCSGIAHQWFGHYIAMETIEDLWIIVGFSRWIAYQFMRKVHGGNEVKYRLKKDMERLCLIDVKQPPLCPEDPKALEELLVGYDFNPFEDSSSIRAELMNIKSPLVLYMMEQRFGKGLLQKVASKIMMTHMSGELSSGLGTILFLKLARKISGKLEIKEFADQWIYRSGSPILTTRYHFNRKKMVIEVRIKQRSSNEGMVGANAKFTGPITIRVQEPSGTFDTEERLEDYEKKYDIIYHTKYKRIRRSAKKGRKGGDDDDGEEDEGDDDVKDEKDEDGDPSEMIAEPDRITFEWIRIDPDSLWVCHKSFEQEDFMWNSVLRQDKDIIAHYEAVIALGKIPSPATCATLMSVLRDSNFFYRVRMEAAFALTKFDTKELEFVGLTNLTKFFRDNYCMNSEELVPKRNNFEDLEDYHIRCAVVTAIVRFRDDRGWSPSICRSMILELLKLNDNTNNKYSDSNWKSLLIDLLSDSFLARPKNADDLSWCLSDRVHYKEAREIRKEDVEVFDLPSESEAFTHRNAETVKLHFNDEDHNLLKRACDEVLQALKRDRFSGSRNNGVTIACLELLIKWQVAGLYALDFSPFLYYSRHGHFPAIRKVAIEGLILLSGLEEEAIARYLGHMCVDDPDPYIRYTSALALMHYIAMACHQISTSSHPESRKKTLRSQMIVLMETWKPIAPERYDFHVYRYLAKITELTRNIIPDEKHRLIYKMPNAKDHDNLGEESAIEENKPLLKPLRFNFKGINVAPSVKKPALAEDKRRKVLKRIMSQKHAHWFKEPVDVVKLGIPSYLEIVKKPMDLGTVKSNLENGLYQGDEDFAADVLLVFQNAMAFNPPSTEVHVDALSLSLQMAKEFGKGVSGLENLDITTGGPRMQETTATIKTVNRKPVDELEGARKVLEKLFNSDHAALFKYPVDGEMYPEYYNVISQPIDLQAIRKKMATNEYQSFQDFHSDMTLLITNCFTFNRKGTFGFAIGNQFQNLYQKFLKPYFKFLDPATMKKVVPGNISVYVPAKPALPAAAVVASVTSTPASQTFGSVNVRLPGKSGKSGITLRLPPRQTAKAQHSAVTQKPDVPAEIKSFPSLTLRLPPRNSITDHNVISTPKLVQPPVSEPIPKPKPIAPSGIKLKFKQKKSSVDDVASVGTEGSPVRPSSVRVDSVPVLDIPDAETHFTIPANSQNQVLPSPEVENIPKPKIKLTFKLGPK